MQIAKNRYKQKKVNTNKKNKVYFFYHWEIRRKVIEGKREGKDITFLGF
jgi:hypothetical protein